MAVMMRWCLLSLALGFSLSLSAWRAATVGAEESSAVLEWKNGDRLAGGLTPSGADAIRWSAPQLADPITVETGVLDSIHFSRASRAATGAFRVTTTTDDAWTGDLVGSDDETLVFATEHFGEIRVKRESIVSIVRRDGAGNAPSDIVLDASRLDGGEDVRGPIEDLRYAVYENFRAIVNRWAEAEGRPTRGAQRVSLRIRDGVVDDLVIDFDRETPVRTGRRSRGYVDLGLGGTDSSRDRAVVFEGRFAVERGGVHRFEVQASHGARVFIDGVPVVEGSPTDGGRGRGQVRSGTVELDRGPHQLRVVSFNSELDPWLSLTLTEPTGDIRQLSGRNIDPNWIRGPGGQAQAVDKKTRLWQPVELPDRFEIDLELISSASPRFLIAIEGGEDEAALSLETWDNLLVVTQGSIFQPIGSIADEQRLVKLRWVIDREAQTLAVFDPVGRRLGEASGVTLPTRNTGLSLRNRGEDLTARRLIVRRWPRPRGAPSPTPTEVDTARARVHLRDGRVLYGSLFVGASGAFVRDDGGEPHAVDLTRIRRVVHPNGVASAVRPAAAFAYADGAIVGGTMRGVVEDGIVLELPFAADPVTCRLSGAAMLALDGSVHRRRAGPGGDADPATGDGASRSDRLVTRAGGLRGQLTFGGEGAPLRWQAFGTQEPVALRQSVDGRLERHAFGVKSDACFDRVRYPAVLHLRSGETLPCRVEALEDATLEDATLVVDSPFMKSHSIALRHVKAMDLTGETLGDDLYRASDDFAETLDRALVVPRFRRKKPHHHLVVAQNGDLMRGRLLSIHGSTVRFDSKLAERSIPIDRLAQIVEVQAAVEGAAEPRIADPSTSIGARVRLSDGTTLVLEITDATGGELRGRSPIYGEVGLPIGPVVSLELGPSGCAPREGPFARWLTRPALEPSWSPKPATQKPATQKPQKKPGQKPADQKQ